MTEANTRRNISCKLLKLNVLTITGLLEFAG